jgi:kynurenine 3-monooxygenase
LDEYRSGKVAFRAEFTCHLYVFNNNSGNFAQVASRHLLNHDPKYLPHRKIGCPAFERARKINTDSIADLAVENFVEMRDRVADPRFLFRKKVEFALEEKFPGHFVPKCAMVTFHRIPYSVAESRGKIQDRMLAELCDSVNRVENADWNKAETLIHRDLTPLGNL